MQPVQKLRVWCVQEMLVDSDMVVHVKCDKPLARFNQWFSGESGSGCGVMRTGFLYGYAASDFPSSEVPHIIEPYTASAILRASSMVRSGMVSVYFFMVRRF